MFQNKKFPYLMIFPVVLLFLAFTLYPIIYSFILSFQSMVAGKYQFVGFNNYQKILGDKTFWLSLKNTLIILVVQVPIMLFLALILANALNSKLIKLKAIYRVGFYLPAVTSLVATSLLFSILLQKNGLINGLLAGINIEPIPWLSDAVWAKISIIITVTWRWTGYNMVIYLAALQNISEELYEAASIDGANKIRQFFSITVPQLRPVILFTTIFSTIGTLQLFDEPFNLTQGGPANATKTLGLYIYETGFNFSRFGYASALSYVVVMIVIVLSLIQSKLTKEK
ncbi:carbohydrate ABC transporter permease [Enterococcus songbeiensis]|uniref:carbohydrate ABC transporter permease n=1 Tax=Enterococcus songbeiensis TaxID=2559927 RepID=UPI0010F520BE|nr:sugar ABC transporter permease [Enterococcus songbeiensis]